MPRSKTIRVSPEATAQLHVLSEQHGSPLGIMSEQIIGWFASQPKSVQGAILGHYPGEIRSDVATLILKKMAGQKAA